VLFTRPEADEGLFPSFLFSEIRRALMVNACVFYDLVSIS